MKERNRSLKTKIFSVIIGTVIAILLCVSLVFFLNIRSIANALLRSNDDMGKTSRFRSSSSMTEMTKARLRELADAKAEMADRMFSEFEQAVCEAAMAAEKLYADPEAFPEREVPQPLAENDGILSLQILYSAAADPEAEEVVRERRLLGNLQELLYSINANNPDIVSNYVATESGLMIQADYISGSKFDEAGNLLPLEAKERPWYIGAAETGKPYFTPVIQDLHTPKLGIMCGVPICRNGQLMGVAGAGMYLANMEEFVKGIELGENGEACVINQFGQVLFSTFDSGVLSVYEGNADLRESNDEGLARIVTHAVNGERDIGYLTVKGLTHYVAYAPLNEVGWTVLVLLSQEEVDGPARQLQTDLSQISKQAADEAQQNINRSVIWLSAVLIVAVILALLLSLFLSRRIVTPIQRLTDEVRQVKGEDLDFRWDLKTGDETQILADSFRSLTERRKTYIHDIQAITAEKERIGTELELARRIQADMLPGTFPAFPDRKDFDIYATMTPAKEVGGDFYDFFLVDEDHLALAIADVSGKGVPASLFMMVAKILLQNHVMNGLSPAEALRETNRQICSNNQEEMFVTVWLGILDLKSGILTAANAGHEYPVLKHPDGHFELIKDPHGFVVGGLPDIDYQEYTWQLKPDSKLFVYTDGVPEANIDRKIFFGTDRMMETLREAENETPEKILRSVEASIASFVGEAPQFDDVTMLCLHYIGSKEKDG